MGTQTPKLAGTSQKWLVLSLLITVVVMGKVVLNGWVNWDDDTFVRNNPLIENPSVESFKEIFSGFHIGVYSPVVLLSYWLDHAIGGFEPGVYHTINLLLHLGNVVLVFSLVQRLFNRVEIAAVTAILFGIHPLSVEVVAWVTARKDLLLTLFFLSGLLQYVKAMEENESATKHKRLTFVFFVLAVLSKGVAVTFPIVLLLIDYLKGRKLDAAVIKEKLPFFLVSIVFGIVAIYAQQESDALGEMNSTVAGESVFIGFYGLTMHLIKTLFPFHLSAFHPYPGNDEGSLPAMIYLTVLVALPLFLMIRNAVRKEQRSVVFGLGFFLVNIALVLQFLPVGAAAYSERYFYLSGIGLLLLIAFVVVHIADRLKAHPLLIVAPLLLFFGAQSVLRIDVWQDSKALWNDVVEKYPEHNFGYFARAQTYTELGDEGKALQDYSKGLELGVDVEALNNRALLYLNKGELDKALFDLNRALKLNPEYVNAVINTGLVYMNGGQPERALKAFNRAIKMEASGALPYFNRGLAHEELGRRSEAIQDITTAITIEENPKFYLERGKLQLFSGDLRSAGMDLNKSLELDPNNPGVHFYLGELSFEQRNLQAALAQYDEAIRRGYKGEQAQVNKGLVLLNMQRFEEAVVVLNNVLKDPAVRSAPAHLNRGIAHHFLGNHAAAIADFDACLAIDPGFEQAREWKQKSLSENR